MKLTIIGATGNVGSRILSQALAAGHDVTVVARRPEVIAAAPNLSVIRGSATDSEAIAQAARDADAVVVAITGKPSDKSFMQTNLPGVIEGLKSAGAPRLVLVSAFGAGDTASKASWYMRFVYRHLLGGFMADKDASDGLLQASGLPWTILYPVNLKDAAATNAAVSLPLDRVAKVPGLPTLPFDDAAAQILAAAENPDTRGQRLLVTTERGFRRA